MLLDDDQQYAIHHGDAIPRMHGMPRESVDFAIYSPPFPSVFSYTSLAADIGNSEGLTSDAPLHFSFFFRAIRPLIKPGRVMIVHCTQIMRMKRTGGEGMFDFRGLLIRLAQRAGFIYEYDWLIRKNPQSQAIRTKARSLQFAGLESDRAQSRGAMGDYLIKFIVPGENVVPITGAGGISRNEWIEWAEAAWWTDIHETDTLNVREGRVESDTRHICPLQLSVIRRCIRLFSNPREIVFSPFAGIGSELYSALKLDRRAFGIEIKPEYHAAALKNCERGMAEHRESQTGLFDPPADPEPAAAAVA